MDYEALIQQFGYLAIFLGTIVEGEVVLLLGGFLAQRDFLDVYGVIALGYLGTYISESAIYHFGRSHGRAFVNRRSPAWQTRYHQFSKRLHRHRYPLILFYRFFYGMRTVAPFAIGTSGVNPLTFHCLNLVGTFMWTSLFASLGYFFGRSVTQFIEKWAEYNTWAVAGIIGLLLVALTVVHLWRSHQNS
ncbi:DedA family protein [Marinobacteraceae bacterium S3BR75-40.1]